MTTPVPLADLFTPEDWFALLEVSLTGIHLVRPVYEPDGTAIVDFAIEYLNPAGQRMTGLAEQPGGTLLGRFPHALAEGIFAYYQRVYETGEQLTYETNYQADGLDNFFKFSARRSGAHLLVSFTDTSEEKRSAVEETLRASQAAEQAAHAVAEQQRQRFREVLTQMPAYIAVYQGPDHIYQFVNPSYRSLFPHRSFLGKPFREGTPESVELGVVALFDQVYQTGEPVYLREMEGWFDFHGNGQPVQVFLNISLHPLRNVQGQIDGVLDFTYDVSEQVRARQQVEQLNQELESRVQQRTQQLEVAQRGTEAERQRLEQLFMQAPAAICILDGPALVYKLVNPTYQRLFPGRTLLGKPLLEALPELTDQPVWHTLQEVYRTGQTHLELGIRIPVARTENGALEDFYFNYVQQARYDAQGRIDGAIVFAFDVTEQVWARGQVQTLNEELAAINEKLTFTNEELHKSNAQLLRTNADLDTFVYTASHDLKAPITNIEGLLLALHDVLPAEVQQTELVAELLRLLHDTVGRFRFTITQLTDLVRLQQSQTGPAELVALGLLLEAVCHDLAAEIRAAGAAVHVQVPADLGVNFNPANLRSIAYNLLSNAVKYRALDRPAQVWVRVEQQAGTVTLAVQDNGLGLDPTQQGRLFQVFQRLHTHVEGTGVGLYMIKRLIENGGATISVSSEPSVGTTFTVTFRA